MRLGSISFFIFVAALAGAAPARADIASPDACTSPNQPCSNAMTSESGICTAATCTRVVPDSDGGTTTMSYACLRCLPRETGGGGDGGRSSAGGARGADNAGGAGGTTTGTGGASPNPPKKEADGCSIAPQAGGSDGRLTAAVSVGLLALVRRRLGRRRSREAR
jgi:hypothetical protein